MWYRGYGVWAIAVLLATAWVSSAWLLDSYGRAQVPKGSYDAIVVAGCRVMPDGRPSHALEARAKLAVKLWYERRANVILFTGGTGTYPPSEAAAAAKVAEGEGIPQARLLLETQSTSTAENARFARQLTQGERILLVTDTYHVYRARWVFRRHFGTVDAVGSTAPTWPRIVGSLREVLAVAYYRLGALVGRHPR